MSSQQPAIRIGARIWWSSMKLGGYVLRLNETVARVVLDNDDQHDVNIRTGAIEARPFAVGARVIGRNGGRGIVSAPAPSEKYPTWRVDWADQPSTTEIEMTLRPAELLDPVERMEAGELSDARAFNLRSAVADMWARNRSEELVSLAHARVDLKPHQVSVAHRVVSESPHRFLLCDEVGLGKTIEAAMVIKELRARGDARRVLILVPSGIQIQWLYELKTKFGETFEIFNREKIAARRLENVHNAWADANSVIAAHSFAAYSDERIEQIASVPWDLIVIDEAHHARRQRHGARQQSTRLYRLVSELTARADFNQRAVLFLTATPMQLQRHELFSLVEMLDHTLFASEHDFERHLSARSGISRVVEELDRALPASPSELIRALPADWPDRATRLLSRPLDHVLDDLSDPIELLESLRSRHRLSEVMLRNRRAVVGGFMPRRAYRWELQLSPGEAAVQEAMGEVIREGMNVAAAQRRNAVGFLMVTWQKLLASSSRALRRSLERRCERLARGDTVDRLSEQMLFEYEDEELSQEDVEGHVREAISDEIARLRRIIALLETIRVDTKATVLAEKLAELFDHDPDGKVLLFTQFRDTQQMLAELIAARGWGASVFHGGLNVTEKDAAVERFRHGAGPQVLISTEAGGEGRNLQFAHLLVNYDLPWNPMRVEQRIGRVDRVGQDHPVSVFNFHVLGSIESRILEVLDERINLFENSIGGLEPILGDVEGDIRAAMRLAADDRDRALAEIGERKQREVEQARLAESQMQDFVLDGRSYSAGIIELVHERAASSVAQEEFERTLTELLGSVNTYIGPKADSGERKLQFHPPFTEERRDLIAGKETRRACFDPRVAVDSHEVEYFGFGHPIVDALVERAILVSAEGAAALRVVSPLAVPLVRSGWQFNWRLMSDGVRRREQIMSVFVDDDGECDLPLGADLLFASRAFDRDEGRGSAAATAPVDRLPAAYEAAEKMIASMRDEQWADLSLEASERHERDTGRIGQLYDNRAAAARKRHDNDRRTLDRLRASPDENDQRVVPIWEENVRRSEAALDLVEQHRIREQQQLNRSLNPDVAYSLLSVARIVPSH